MLLFLSSTLSFHDVGFHSSTLIVFLFFCPIESILVTSDPRDQVERFLVGVAECFRSRILQIWQQQHSTETGNREVLVPTSSFSATGIGSLPPKPVDSLIVDGTTSSSTAETGLLREENTVGTTDLLNVVPTSAPIAPSVGASDHQIGGGAIGMTMAIPSDAVINDPNHLYSITALLDEPSPMLSRSRRGSLNSGLGTGRPGLGGRTGVDFGGLESLSDGDDALFIDPLAYRIPCPASSGGNLK